MIPRPLPLVPVGPELKGTNEAPCPPPEGWTARGKLPFSEPPPPDPSAPKANRTQKVPGYRGRVETLGVSGDSKVWPVPAVPFAGRAEPAVIHLPELTPRQFIGLRATLALWPQHAEQTLRAYGLPSKAAYAALLGQWRRKAEGDPSLRAVVRALAADFARWLAEPVE